MKVVFLNAKAQTVEVKDITNELDSFHKLLDCDLFDIPNRQIGENRYDIFVDDEGLLRDAPIVSGVDINGKAMLVGNLVICSNDGQGETIGLTEEEIAEVLSHVLTVTDIKGNRYTVVVMGY